MLQAKSSEGMKALWELGAPEKLRKGYVFPHHLFRFDIFSMPRG